MFANRYTALIDACSLVDSLRRNLLLTLAEAEFFRLRWSKRILDEMEAAISGILEKRGREDHMAQARRNRRAMEIAFADAEVTGFEAMASACANLPDPDDVHVLAAALKTQAAVIVTENLKDFPERVLGSLNLEARSADAFIADTIDLDHGRAVAAIRRMRMRLKRPDVTAAGFLLKLEAAGLTQTVDVLRRFESSL